ncbi:uncharacterized protein METZ01_LOCUS439350, partial [marine metagenome]
MPKYNDTIFLNQSDEEQTTILFRIVNKNKKLVLDTARNAREKLIYDLIIGIVNARFNALNDKGKMNYDLALLGRYSITSKTDTFLIAGLLKEDEIKEGLKTILIELERIKQNGFIEKELELFKKKQVSFTEQALKSKKTRENNSHVSEISRNFLEDEFVVGEERETELDKKLLKTINVSDLNEAFKKWFKYDDRIVNFRYPKKIGNKITKDVFLSIEKQIKNIQLAQYEFTLDDKPLIEKEL